MKTILLLIHDDASAVGASPVEETARARDNTRMLTARRGAGRRDRRRPAPGRAVLPRDARRDAELVVRSGRPATLQGAGAALPADCPILLLLAH
jgi:hypothetical protein